MPFQYLGDCAPAIIEPNSETIVDLRTELKESLSPVRLFIWGDNTNGEYRRLIIVRYGFKSRSPYHNFVKGKCPRGWYAQVRPNTVRLCSPSHARPRSVIGFRRKSGSTPRLQNLTKIRVSSKSATASDCKSDVFGHRWIDTTLAHQYGHVAKW